jgi:hypothetical protein
MMIPLKLSNCQKDLDETNPTSSSTITNGDKDRSHEPSKYDKWLTCLWVARVAHPNYRWWYFLVSLDSYLWDLFCSIDDVIIDVLVHLQDLFRLSLSLSFILIVICKRDEREKRKKISKAYQNFDNNIIGIIKKILMR